MNRWLLTNISTVGISLLFVVGAASLAIGGFLIAETVYPGLRESNLRDVSGEIGAAFTLLFGLILALTIADISANSATAATTVSDEATILAQLTRSAQDFSPAARGSLKAAVGQYVHAIAEDEFATMAKGEASPVAAGALANLYGVYQGYTPAPEEQVSYESSLLKIDQLTAARRARLQLSAQSLSPLLRIVLFLGTVVFIILSYPTRIESKAIRLAVTGAIAGFVVFVFALTILLDYPFVGDIAVSNAPYKEAALAQYWPGL